MKAPVATQHAASLHGLGMIVQAGRRNAPRRFLGNHEAPPIGSRLGDPTCRSMRAIGMLRELRRRRAEQLSFSIEPDISKRCQKKPNNRGYRYVSNIVVVQCLRDVDDSHNGKREHCCPKGHFNSRTVGGLISPFEIVKAHFSRILDQLRILSEIAIYQQLNQADKPATS